MAVWKGSSEAGKIFVRLRADRDGFFSLDLPPGTYTLALTLTGGGYPRPVTVKVVPGHLVSAGVISSER